MASAPKFFAITLQRSLIGASKSTRAVADHLGLTKRLKTVFRPVCASVAGEILKIKELVSVETVDRAMSKEEQREERRPERGYRVVGRMCGTDKVYF